VVVKTGLPVYKSGIKIPFFNKNFGTSCDFPQIFREIFKKFELLYPPRFLAHVWNELGAPQNIQYY